MSDYLSRLGERATGKVSWVQPKIAPIFSSLHSAANFLPRIDNDENQAEKTPGAKPMREIESFVAANPMRNSPAANAPEVDTSAAPPHAVFAPLHKPPIQPRATAHEVEHDGVTDRLTGSFRPSGDLNTSQQTFARSGEPPTQALSSHEPRFSSVEPAKDTISTPIFERAAVPVAPVVQKESLQLDESKREPPRRSGPIVQPDVENSQSRARRETRFENRPDDAPAPSRRETGPRQTILQRHVASQPAVRVNIGRIEVRAVQTAAAPAVQPRRQAPPPTITLSDYLAKDRGSRP